MSQEYRIPPDPKNDYFPELAAGRREFATRRTGACLDTVGNYPIDPAVTRANIESFIGTVHRPTAERTRTTVSPRYLLLPEKRPCSFALAGKIVQLMLFCYYNHLP